MERGEPVQLSVAVNVVLVIFLTASTATGLRDTPSGGVFFLEELVPGRMHSCQQCAGLPSLEPKGLKLAGVCAGRGVITQYERWGVGAPGDETGGLRARLTGEGIDFYARGNEPFWALDMDLDSVMHFTAGGELALTVPAVEGVRAKDGEALRFDARSEEGILTATITREKCVDPMSGEEFTHTVHVEVKTFREREFQRFKGCGRYLPDPRLARSWSLQELDGEAVSGEGLLKGPPRLEFFVEEGRIGGHGGCNSITGIYINEWNVIRFGQIAHTLMACPEMAVEQKFLATISGHSFRYVLRDQELIISGQDGTILRFLSVSD